MTSLPQLEDARISCPDCSRTHRWTAERAGRRARCRCGEVLRFPLAPPAAPGSSRGFDLEPRWAEQDLPCPECGVELAQRAELCLECGFHQRLGRRVSTLGEERGVRLGQSGREQGHRELVFDLILLGVAGLALISAFSQAHVSAPAINAVLRLLISVGACGLSAIALGALLGIPFGPLVPALAKFGQVGAASAATLLWVNASLGGGLGGLVFGLFAYLLVYIVLLMWRLRANLACALGLALPCLAIEHFLIPRALEWVVTNL